MRKLMKKDVFTVTPETPTLEALRTMRRLQVGCLPVVHDERLVGIVTEGDFLEIASKLLEHELAADDIVAEEPSRQLELPTGPHARPMDGHITSAGAEPAKADAKTDPKADAKSESKAEPDTDQVAALTDSD